MSRFNQQSTSAFKPDTSNLAGGSAHSMSPIKEIVTILFTSFLTDKFYEKADQTVARLSVLIAALRTEADKKLTAKAVIYARTVFGMRSITHAAAAELSKHISGFKWAADFFTAVIYRPDDMTEIFSYLKAQQGNKKKFKVPVAMKKGFAVAFDTIKPYSLAKYRSDDKSVKLVDVINVCHPKPNEMNAGALKQLLKGELKQEETWEAMLSAAGKDAGKKEAVWTNLLKEKKLGYLALLRNIRNIIEQAPAALPLALEALTSEAFIKKSLILPFQYMTAYEEMVKLGPSISSQARIAMVAISKAIDISLSNVPTFEGETLVVLDVSGSMTTATGKNKQTPAKIGALFAAVLVKASNADFMTFDYDAKYHMMNTLDSTVTLASGIQFPGGSTNFPSIFMRAAKKYDRIIVLSDMQGWGHGQGIDSFVTAYRGKYKANPLIYSFDLNGYGSLQFHEDRTFLLAGFSDKTMQIMQYLEKDKDAMLTEINRTILLAETIRP